MKKFIYSICSLMLVLVLSVSIISCSKDDAGTKNSSNLENTLMQYCWRSDTFFDFMEWGDNEASFSRDNETLYFLGDGSGIMKCNYHVSDSYFGTSSSVTAYPFTYYVSGSTVTMYLKQTVTCTYNGNALVSTNSTWNFNKKSLTSDDQKWLKKAVYEVMPDEERCDIKFDHSCKYLYSAEGDVNVEVTLSLSASEMASSRKLQRLTATYKGPGIIKSGYGTSYTDYQKQTNEILIFDDKDYTESKWLSFKGELPLTLDVTFSVWDYKNQEEVYLGSEEIVITGEGETSEDASGNKDDKPSKPSEKNVFTVNADVAQPMVTLSGRVEGVTSKVEAGFVIGLTNNLSEKNGLKYGVDPTDGEFTKIIRGLTERTTYYYRAFAQIDGTYKWGDIKSFTTSTSEPYTYTIDGKTYGMVRVEGGNLNPFYIMQTEMPISEMDLDGNGRVNQGELGYYINDLGNRTGKPFRLPTQEEWEYAARGGQKSKGYTYSGSNAIDDVAWYSGNSGKSVQAFATKQPNELGLYDMSGNYAEFCVSKRKSLFGGENVWGDILCGGSWKDSAYNCKPSSWMTRSKTGQWIVTLDHSYITVRLVYSEREDKSWFNQ